MCVCDVYIQIFVNMLYCYGQVYLIRRKKETLRNKFRFEKGQVSSHFFIFAKETYEC